MVYRRYASLFFIAGCASTDNELITLEIVHRYVEQMDKYYGNVCELDIIFNFQKAYFILDELILAGEMQESSKKNVLRVISQQDSLEDMEVSIFVPRLCMQSQPIVRNCCYLRIAQTPSLAAHRNFAPFHATATNFVSLYSSGRRRSHQDHVTSLSNTKSEPQNDEAVWSRVWLTGSLG